MFVMITGIVMAKCKKKKQKPKKHNRNYCDMLRKPPEEISARRIGIGMVMFALCSLLLGLLMLQSGFEEGESGCVWHTAIHRKQNTETQKTALGLCLH